MNEGSVSGENRRFDRRAFAVEGAPIERNVNDVFEVKINCVGCNCVRKSIEWLLQRSLEFAEDSYDFVNSCLIHKAARPPDDQPNIFVKLDIRRKLHCGYNSLLQPAFLGNVSLRLCPGNSFHREFLLERHIDNPKKATSAQWDFGPTSIAFSHFTKGIQASLEAPPAIALRPCVL